MSYLARIIDPFGVNGATADLVASVDRFDAWKSRDAIQLVFAFHRTDADRLANAPPIMTFPLTIPPGGRAADYGPAPLVTEPTFDPDTGELLTPAVYGPRPVLLPYIPPLSWWIGQHGDLFAGVDGLTDLVLKAEPGFAPAPPPA